ncbi:MAG: GNAT family N-acetyltransferase [Deltaproteobacteria bacterium]|nr:GNAT family N-acetyltransferase [Deltaproteobacteria bacterium]
MIDYRTGINSIYWEALANLYLQVGLGIGKKDVATLRQAFEGSGKVVTAWHNGELVGAGRMITDGIRYGSIFDVGVLPAFQKQGIGKDIMNELIKGNEHLYIHLTSTFGNELFYSKLGFRRHKTAMAKYPHDSDYLE